MFLDHKPGSRKTGAKEGLALKRTLVGLSFMSKFITALIIMPARHGPYRARPVMVIGRCLYYRGAMAAPRSH